MDYSILVFWGTMLQACEILVFWPRVEPGHPKCTRELPDSASTEMGLLNHPIVSN